MSIAEKYEVIRANINEALKKSPFGKRKVFVMGASKDQSLNKLREAAELGITSMGENYAQELIRKAPMCMDVNINWHFIGRLQSNKLKHLMPYVASIDSVDSLELAQRIGREKEKAKLKMPRFPIMIQVNLGNERQKSGLPPYVIEELFEEFTTQEGVEVTGLMTIPPYFKEAEKSRDYFKDMKKLFDKLKEKHPRKENFIYLNMGMSNDYAIAVEEGANLLRVGTALFGPRPPKE